MTAAITSIAGSTYLNGLSAETEYSQIGSWMSWDLSAISVIKSPSPSDGYSRIFWTGESDEKLYCKGTFGTRTVNYPIPAQITKIQGTDLYSPNAVTATWTATNCATQAMELSTITATGTGYNAKFTFKSQTDTISGTSVPTPVITVNIPGIGSLTAPNGLQYDQTTTDQDGNLVTWASPEFTSITPSGGTFTATTGTSTTTIVWDATEFTVAWDMHYKLTDEYVYYLMTFVDDLGVEGPASDVSIQYHRTSETRTVVSSLPVSTDSTIKKKRLYRSSAGANTDGFYFLVELDNSVTSYVDVTPDADMAEKFTPYYNPPDGLQGLICLPNGIACAFSGKDVWFSDAYIPTSWNPENVITVTFPVVGLAASGNDCVVMTKGRPSLISGDAPENMSAQEIPLEQGCVSRRGIASIGNTVIYPSADGLISIAGANADLITRQYYKREDWQAIDPDTAIAAAHDDRYHIFTDNTSLIVDLKNPDGGLLITSTDESCSALFSDSETDELYLARQDVIDPTWNSWDTLYTGGSNFPVGPHVAYDNNKTLVAGSYQGIIVSTDNGATWTLNTAYGSLAKEIAYGNGFFLVIEGGGYYRGYFYSYDGITWSSYAHVPYAVKNIVYSKDQNKFVTICNANGTLTAQITSNATSWTTASIATYVEFTNWDYANSCWPLAYGNGLYITQNGDGKIYTSSNAITWTARGTLPQLYRVEYLNDRFVATDGTNIYTTTDGITWNTIAPGDTYIRCLGYGNGYYLAFSSTGVWVSEDAKKWTKTAGTMPVDLTRDDPVGFVFVNDTYFLAGDNSIASTGGNKINLASWDTSSTAKTYTWKSKEFQFQRIVDMQDVRIIADSYSNVTFYVYANGNLKYSLPITNYYSKRLPQSRQERVWSFAVTGQSPIDQIQVSTSMGDLVK